MKIHWSDLKVFSSIGSGSFGRVYHGELLGTEVAIKECVRSENKSFDQKYFQREVDILKDSRHPNIVQFMGVCKRKKRFYIITEFLPLGNLRKWIQDDTKEFSWDTRISFAIDISLALAYLHHKKIIHRDMKGENILIADNMRIKICDFGFSRVEAKNEYELSRMSYCGTDGYMAPEILLGEDFDVSVDVFSFGIILCEMMARHVVDEFHFQRIPPHMGISADEVVFRAQDGCPPELAELAIDCAEALPECRPKLAEIVARLTKIESMDDHVGIQLLAPSVARANRRMQATLDMNQRSNQTLANNLKQLDQQQQHYHQQQDVSDDATSTYRMPRPNHPKDSSDIPLITSQYSEGSSEFVLKTPDMRLVADELRFHHLAAASMTGSEDDNVSVAAAQHGGGYSDMASPSMVFTDTGSIAIRLDDEVDYMQGDLDDDSDEDSLDGDMSGGGTFRAGFHEGSELSDSEEDEDEDTGSESSGISMSSLTTESVIRRLNNLNIPDVDSEFQYEDTATLNNQGQGAVQPGKDTLERQLPAIPNHDNPWSWSAALAATVGPTKVVTTTTNVKSEEPVANQADENPFKDPQDKFPPAPPSKTSFLMRADTLRSQTMSLTATMTATWGKYMWQESESSSGNSSGNNSNNNHTQQPLIKEENTEDDSLLAGSTLTGTDPQNYSGDSLPSSESSSAAAALTFVPGHVTGPRVMSDSFWTVGAAPATTAATTATTNNTNNNDMPPPPLAATPTKAATPPKRTNTFKRLLPDKKPPKKQQQLQPSGGNQSSSSGGETPPARPGSAAGGGGGPVATNGVLGTVHNNSNNNLLHPQFAPSVPTAAITGIPHRFSLVMFSNSLLPKCDVCQKRFGVMPGWTKHLACDDCGYKTHTRCSPEVAKSCTSKRRSGVWDLDMNSILP